MLPDTHNRQQFYVKYYDRQGKYRISIKHINHISLFHYSCVCIRSSRLFFEPCRPRSRFVVRWPIRISRTSQSFCETTQFSCRVCLFLKDTNILRVLHFCLFWRANFSHCSISTANTFKITHLKQTPKFSLQLKKKRRVRRTTTIIRSVHLGSPSVFDFCLCHRSSERSGSLGTREETGIGTQRKTNRACCKSSEKTFANRQTLFQQVFFGAQNLCCLDASGCTTGWFESLSSR